MNCKTFTEKAKIEEQMKSYIEENEINGYALVYMMSELILCKLKDLEQKNIDWKECLEVRFFCRKSELHCYLDEENWLAVLVVDEEVNMNVQCEKEYRIKKYELLKKFKDLGNHVRVKEYLSFDEDGQIFIKLTRLLDIGEER